MTIKTDLPILLVSDYQTLLKILKHLLTQLGFRAVDEAASGEAALRRLQDKPYGLIMADWNMRPMSGMDLLRTVRADSRLTPIPLILITSEETADHVAKAKQAGASGYMVNPFNAETLQQTLARVLGA